MRGFKVIITSVIGPTLFLLSAAVAHAEEGELAAGAVPTASNSSVSADEQGAELRIEEVVVTARRREESLQRVPDAITALTSDTIAAAKIEHLADVIQFTPNMYIADGFSFRSGFFTLSARGISNGQYGWAAVSYIVDGVPATSLDEINGGSLEDIERIEVLRGPQSALYGFNAIAGAINVITKAPTNEWEGKIRADYGNGPDRVIAGLVSGPLIRDTLLLRVGGLYRDFGGLVDSTSNGIPLDFRIQKQAQLRMLFTPIETFKVDLHGYYDREDNGSSYQDKIPTIGSLNDFPEAFNARRGFSGRDHEESYQLSSRMQWDLEAVSLIGVIGYSHNNSEIRSSVCYDDPNDPALPYGLPSDPNPLARPPTPAFTGHARCLFDSLSGAPFFLPFSPALGNAAGPFQTVDDFFNDVLQYRSFTSDVRLASRGAGPLQWTLGASTLHRDTLHGLDAGLLLAPDPTSLTLFPQWNRGFDNWWGVYGELTWEVTPRLELTVAGRYDDERYNNTSFTDGTMKTVTPVPSLQNPSVFVDTQYAEAKKFQPKGSLSYRITDDIMGYATVSRGFRAGYFLSGGYSVPEHTTNYELGVKSTLWDRVIVNGDVFYIDYSDQQTSTLIPAPPYLVAMTIPKTHIPGAEVEATIRASRFVTFGLGVGYLNAQIAGGSGKPPLSPDVTANASVDVSYPLARSWTAHLRVDDRYTSPYSGAVGTPELVAQNYVNGRLGIQNDRFDVSGYVRNATAEQAAVYAIQFTGGYIRQQNQPRSYGLEMRYSF